MVRDTGLATAAFGCEAAEVLDRLDLNNDIYNGRCATFILAAEGSRFDHLVQEVLDGHRSASTTTEAEDYGR